MSQTTSVLYVTGEESAEQVALRARRLDLQTGNVNLLAEIRLEAIQAAVSEQKPTVAVIDSIQTLYSGELSAAPGSVSQVRECAAQLTRLAKQTGIAIVMIGHVTKDGALAGPRVLEHIVDTVLYFEGDTHSSRVRDDRSRPARRGQSLGAVPVAARAAGRGFLRDGHARGHAAAAGRDPGAGRQFPRAQSAPADGRPGGQPPGQAAGGTAPACRRHDLRPGRVRQCGGRRAHYRTGGRLAGAVGHHVVAARQAAAARPDRVR
ncbi:hypothetical protein G6F68_012211 [Rhizopus microsporus]|nr:hypothetical protein G6F68_012211 [Rhizopus microsporus]